MSLQIASLNSGSNGNCYYVGNKHEAVLIDAGLTCRETVRRLKRLGLSIDKVKAIFISHEHGDHIKGVEVLAGKYKLPIYITDATLKNSSIRRNRVYMAPFYAYEPVSVGGLTVKAFPKFHDAIDPHSFIVSGNDVNIGVFTDIGKPCEHVVEHFKLCHAAFLETNYDEKMLAEGRYPPHLKNRISGDNGHLSNKQALDLFKAHKPKYMSYVLLSHLSAENNSPELAKKLFDSYADNTTIVIASRHIESAVYTIEKDIKLKHPVQAKAEQISMF